MRQEGYADFDQGTQETAPCQQFTLIHVICPPWQRIKATASPMEAAWSALRSEEAVCKQSQHSPSCA